MEYKFKTMKLRNDRTFINLKSNYDITTGYTDTINKKRFDEVNVLLQRFDTGRIYMTAFERINGKIYTTTNYKDNRYIQEDSLTPYDALELINNYLSEAKNEK